MAGMISAALIASRLLHFTALMVLFGSSLFSLYAVPRAGTPDEMELVRRLNCWLHRLVTGAAGLTLVSGVALLGCTAVAMSGDPAAAWHGDTLRLVVFNTRFGRVWQWQFAIAVLLFLFSLCIRRLYRKRLVVMVASSGALLVTAAWIGHASMGSGAFRLVRLLNQSIHLTAAATWLGGLLSLGFVLAVARRAASEPWASLTRKALSRFSHLGTLVVALLLATGITNSWFLVGSVAARHALRPHSPAEDRFVHDHGIVRSDQPATVDATHRSEPHAQQRWQTDNERTLSECSRGTGPRSLRSSRGQPPRRAAARRSMK
jgi:copper resistance protein D